MLNSGSVGRGYISHGQGAEEEANFIKDAKLFPPVASTGEDRHDELVAATQERQIREVFGDSDSGLGQKLPQIFIPAVGNVRGVGLESARMDAERETEFETELFGGSTEYCTGLGTRDDLLEESFDMTDLLLEVRMGKAKAMEGFGTEQYGARCVLRNSGLLERRGEGRGEDLVPVIVGDSSYRHRVT